MEGGIDVLDHVGHIGFLLVDKLINGPKLWLKRPVTQFLHLSPLDFVESQEFAVVLLVGFKEARLADETRGQIAVSSNANVKDILAIMAL